MNKRSARKKMFSREPGGPERTEATLRESEASFRNLMEYIPGISIQGYRADGRVVYWNRASQEVYGYSAREAIGKDLSDLIIPPDLKGLFRKSLEIGGKARKSGEFMPPGELMLLHKKGHPVPVYSIHTAVCVEGREPILFRIDVNLSEWKKKEEIIARLNRCFLSLGADPRKNIEILTEAAAKILGGSCLLYNRLEKERGLLSTWGIWRKPEGYQPEDDPDGHICYDVIRKGGDGPVIIEDLTGTGYEKTDPNVKKYGFKSYLGYPVRLKDKVVGSFCLCDIKPRRFTGQEIRIIGMLARAVSIEEERLWTRRVIERAKREWENTMDAVPDLIMILDEDYRILRANKVTAGKLGVPVTELPGKTCYRAVHGMDAPPDFCPQAKLLQDGREHKVEVRLDRLGGDFLITTSPLRDGDGRLTGSVHVARDITELKKTEEELKRHRDHLEKMVEERTAELRETIDLMAGREVRMAGLKESIRLLRRQIEEAGMVPVADDPLRGGYRTGKDGRGEVGGDERNR